MAQGSLILMAALAQPVSDTAGVEHFICTMNVSSDHAQEIYAIDIERKSRSISVADAGTKTPFPVSVVQLDENKAVFAFNSIRFDAQSVRMGKVRPTNYTVHSEALLDFRSHAMVVVGGVVDANGREMSIDELNAAKDSEAQEAARTNRKPLNHPMFWDMLGIAVYSKRGSCASVTPNG